MNNKIMSFSGLHCRLCLLESNANVPIFTNSYDEIRHGYLAHKIMQIANVQVYENDGLPAVICRACLCRVEGFFQFKVQIEKSDFFLRQQVCHYQEEALHTPCVEKTHVEHVKSEPLQILKNGVYITENIWTDSVQGFTSISNLAETVTIATPEEVSDVLAEGSQPTFIDLGSRGNEEEKSLLDLTQQEGKILQPSEIQPEFQSNTSNNPTVDESVAREIKTPNDKIDSQYTNIICSQSIDVNLEESKKNGTDKEKSFYNLDQNKEATSTENNFLSTNHNKSFEEYKKKVTDKEKSFYNLDQNKDPTSTENHFLNTDHNKSFENESNVTNSQCDNGSEENVCTNNDVNQSKFLDKTISYCEECDKHFDKPVNLKKHQIQHSKELQKCPFCSKSFKQSCNLHLHIQTHTGEHRFVCSICSKSFTDKSSLKVHAQEAHFTEKTFICSYCKKSFKLKKQLERHERVHTGYNYHRCEICGNLFTQKSNLMKHLVIHSGEKPHPCPVCKQQFAQKDNLNTHVMRHHSQQNPVVCDVCGKIFKNKMTLMGHKKNKHSENAKEIICEVCGKFFPDRSCMNSHKWVHNSSGPEQCDLCGKTYPHARALRVHKRIVHSEVRKHRCDVCGIGFKTSQTLKHHKVVHTGERAFICTECGRSFGQKTALKTHLRIHSGVEPYSCSQCGESFKWKQTRDKHTVKCVAKPREGFINVASNSVASELKPELC